MKADERELLLAPDREQWSGELSIEAGPAMATAMSFDLRPYAPRANGHGQVAEAQP
jgi:hypothetical protein